MMEEIVEKLEDPIQGSGTKGAHIENGKPNLAAPHELLGSLTTFPKTGPVRTSARVIHKLRVPAQPEKKEVKLDVVPSLPKTPNQSKTQRVQWTNIERNYFFDALNESGRDFEQIARFINLKMKRKSPTEIDYKTKEHVRQLYYQLFQKASKYLCFSDDVKKLPQELYTLINYGEMKKKLIMSSEKSFLKLRELVYKGSVTIRVKGKNIKIKTPSCRALRKLNQLEGSSVEDVQLPQRVEVTLRPSNMESWGFVQSLAQNPRIRSALPLQKRVACLLQTIQQKWRSPTLRLHEKYVSIPIHQHGRQKISEENTHQSEIDQIHLKEMEPQLRFVPPKDVTIHRPMVQLTEVLSSCNICLNSYESRIGAKTRGESLSLEKIMQIKDLMKGSAKRIRNDSASEKNSSPENKKSKVDDLKPLSDKMPNDLGIISLFDSKSNDSNDMTDKPLKEEIENFMILENQVDSDAVDFAVDNVFSMKHENSTDARREDAEDLSGSPNLLKNENCDTINKAINQKPQPLNMQPHQAGSTPPTKYKKNIKETFINSVGNIRAAKETAFKPLINDDTIKKIRKGWTLQSAGDLTIGDLYLMFGFDSKLTLEYQWIGVTDNRTEMNEETLEHARSSIGSRLKQLLTVASLMGQSTTQNNCSCGHICEKGVTEINATESGTFKQPLAPKHYNEIQRPVLNVNPRIQYSSQSRWWRNQQQRPRIQNGPELSSLQMKPTTSAPANIVVRNLYQTPASTSPSSSSIRNRQGNEQCSKNQQTAKYVDEVTEILEEKIQKLAETRQVSDDTLYPETSRSSMKSLLECFSADNPPSEQSRSSNLYSSDSIFNVGPIKNVNPPVEMDNISLTSFLGHLDNFYEPDPSIDETDSQEEFYTNLKEFSA